ncbi:MAG: hypothetical protein M1469_02115 [Bacteroidetes bacterium]|nr:hypothetical protein [Bacteroidota bacterium]
MSKNSSEPDMKEIVDAILAGVTDLARSILGGGLIEAKYDVKNFLESIRDDMSKWTGELASGRISPEDFSRLIKTRQEQAEMKLLVEAEIPVARIERFKESVIEMICRTVQSRTAKA